MTNRWRRPPEVTIAGGKPIHTTLATRPLAPRTFTVRPGNSRLHAVPSDRSESPSALQGRIAIVLSNSEHRATRLLPVLARLGVTTLDRAFDASALGIVTAVHPDLAIIECDPRSPDAAAWISALHRESDARLLVIDLGNSAPGKVTALDLGADAVLRADDDAALVRATVSALLRRIGPTSEHISGAAPSVITLAGMTINNGTFEAHESGELIPLTPTEFRILSHLASTPGLVCSANDVMAAVHDYSYTTSEAQQTVKVYIRRIRRKLEACARTSVEVVNARSFGYRIQPTTGGTLTLVA